MGQIGVALWLPRTMALPAPMLSPTLSRRARATPRWLTCSPRCTLSSPSRVPRRSPRLARPMRTLQPRSATLSAPRVTVWAPRILWLSVSPRLLLPKRRLLLPAWLWSWVTSTSAWMARPLPTLSRRRHVPSMTLKGSPLRGQNPANLRGNR